MGLAIIAYAALLQSAMILPKLSMLEFERKVKPEIEMKMAAIGKRSMEGETDELMIEEVGNYFKEV